MPLLWWGHPETGRELPEQPGVTRPVQAVERALGAGVVEEVAEVTRDQYIFLLVRGHFFLLVRGHGRYRGAVLVPASSINGGERRAQR